MTSISPFATFDWRFAAAVVTALLMLAPSAALGGTKAVRFGRLWDGTRVWIDAFVIIDGDRITGIVSDRREVPEGSELVDLRRYFGLPGLIDVHTHMTYYWDRKSGTRPREERRHPAVTVFLAQENARRTLEAGVTTVRDLNASGEMDLAMRDLINMGAMIGPRMFVSGRGLFSSSDGKTPDPDRFRRLAEERIKSGADWVKVFGSHGGFENVDGTQTVSFEEMKAVVETAHALGKRVAIHSYGPSGVRDAARAGADSIEHGADLDDETLALMARRKIFWVPTIDHNRYYIEAKDDYGFAPGSEAALARYIERNLDSARRAVKAGVRLAMGSDAVYTMFGQNTRELGWFVKAGMTPEEALVAATVNGAELLGLEDRIGRVAPGFLADLIASDGNPLQQIDALFAGVRWVMKGGAVVVDKR